MENNLRKSEIPKLIETFFLSCDVDEKLNKYSFFLIRQDGVILYQNKKSKSADAHSIGALLSGVWQASHALTSFLPDSKKSTEIDFRLSFDTSSEGIYIVPVDIKIEKFFLGLIYSNEVNPGQVKAKIRDMGLSLSEFLLMEKIETKKNSATKKNELLFDDITDAEMDRLFSGF